VLIYK